MKIDTSLGAELDRNNSKFSGWFISEDEYKEEYYYHVEMNFSDSVLPGPKKFLIDEMKILHWDMTEHGKRYWFDAFGVHIIAIECPSHNTPEQQMRASIFYHTGRTIDECNEPFTCLKIIQKL